MPTKKELDFAIEVFEDVLEQLNKMKNWGFFKAKHSAKRGLERQKGIMAEPYREKRAIQPNWYKGKCKKWHHIQTTYMNNTFYIYFDGKSIGEFEFYPKQPKKWWEFWKQPP